MNFIQIISFGILIIIPYNQIFAFDFIGIKESDLKGDKTYEDFYFTFYNDYEKINPMTKKDSIKKFLDRLLQDKLMSKDDYDKILQNIDKVNLMEFYYKARKNFADSLLMKVFMNMPELDNRNKTIKRKSFLDRLKEHSRTNKIQLINLILAQINQNNNKNNTEQSDNDNNNENANNNKNNNNDLIAQTQQRSSIRGLNINPLEQLTNQLSGNLSSINTNTNRVGNNININISINITKEDKDKKKEDKENKDKKRKSSLSKKNMDIFKHLIKTEQNKILSYYRNPVLFGIKKMMEGIIFDKKEEKEDKKEINNLNKINEMIEDSAEEENRTLKDKDIAGKKKIKIKVKKKIKKKIKVKKKKKKTIENDSISNSNSNGYNNNIEIQDYDNEPSF